MTTEPYGESVQEAVARETARRKRVLLAFLGLLLLPISIGVYALSKAPTEIEKVATDVTPIVTERVSRDVATRVTDDVVKRTEPLVRQNVSREVSAVVEPRIASATSSLRGDITTLQTTVQQTSELITRATPQLAAVSGLGDRLSALDGDQRRLREEMVSDRELARGLSQKIDRVNTQVAHEATSSRQQLAEFRQTLTNELASIRAVANSSVQTANANKEAITSLARRIAAVEGELKNLQARVTVIEGERRGRTPQ